MVAIFQGLLVIVLAVLGCVAYYGLSNALLDRMLPATGKRAEANIRRAAIIRPWLFMGPALAFLSLYLVYPVFFSLYLSLINKNDDAIGLSNYQWLIFDTKFQESFVNNMLWLLIVPALATLFGLIAAAITDRLSWGNIAKSFIFMPMAISFVGASVIWRFIYDYRGEGETQIGLLNALVTSLGWLPQAWLTLPFWNSVFLMIILVWIQTGFAMVILSAALRGIPQETIEAAIIDGANPWQIFIKIKIPQISKTIAVVWTTITILVLKVFDIVLAMTNGQWGSQVLANYMFDWMFRSNDSGRASAIAIVIMVLVLPILVWNIRQARSELSRH